MTIENIIQQYASATPEKIAIISGDVEVTYSDLWNGIRQKASYFKKKGIQHGERVIISASKNIDFVYCYFGAHMAGLICVPIDSETNGTRLLRIVNCSQPAIIIGELRHKDHYEVVPFSEIQSEEMIADDVFPQENDIADLLFTTGTTGLPKGVALSFKNELAAANNINTFIQNTSEDRELLALPISHSFGLGRLRCVLCKGATLVILGSFASMKKFYGEMERCKITGFGMVPASWSYISKMSRDKISQFANQLKYIEIGSAFMPLEEKKRLMNLLPQTRICMHYGLTEASRSAFINFHEDENHLDSVGKASPNTDIEIFNEQGGIVPVGEEGEICVKGNHVCSDYWGYAPEDFQKEFYGEYFRTGDCGTKDHEGYIYIKSRIKEIINVGGKKVSPLEVEEALNLIDGIEESACVGVHDDVLGEVVKAFVVGTVSVEDDAEIKKILTAKLENYKVPAVIEHISSIPKTHNGKIQRLALKNK